MGFKHTECEVCHERVPNRGPQRVTIRYMGAETVMHARCAVSRGVPGMPFLAGFAAGRNKIPNALLGEFRDLHPKIVSGTVR